MTPIDMPTAADSVAVRSLLPEPAVQRLPWYLAYVSQLRALGVDSVSSTQISRQLNLDSSLIAKDLSYLNLRGKPRVGYDVEQLEAALADFLCFRKAHRAVVFGVGSLGAALMADKGLERYGLEIVAGFDIRSKAPIGGIPVFAVGEASRRVAELGAVVGIITVPRDVAESVATLAVEAGVKALWNFSPTRLSPREGIVVQDTSLYSHLALMYNRLEQLNGR